MRLLTKKGNRRCFAQITIPIEYFIRNGLPIAFFRIRPKRLLIKIGKIEWWLICTQTVINQLDSTKMNWKWTIPKKDLILSTMMYNIFKLELKRVRWVFIYKIRRISWDLIMGLVEINITKILIRQFRKRKVKKIRVHL